MWVWSGDNRFEDGTDEVERGWDGGRVEGTDEFDRFDIRDETEENFKVERKGTRFWLRFWTWPDNFAKGISDELDLQVEGELGVVNAIERDCISL